MLPVIVQFCIEQPGTSVNHAHDTVGRPAGVDYQVAQRDVLAALLTITEPRPAPIRPVSQRQAADGDVQGAGAAVDIKTR